MPISDKAPIISFLIILICSQSLSIQLQIFDQHYSQNDNTCYMPTDVSCPNITNCSGYETVIILQETNYNCDFSVQATLIQVQGGSFVGDVNLFGQNITFNKSKVFVDGQLIILLNDTLDNHPTVYISSQIYTTQVIKILPDTNISQITSMNIMIDNAIMTSKKIVIQAKNIGIRSVSQITTIQNVCLYNPLFNNQFVQYSSNTPHNISVNITSLQTLPLNIIIYGVETFDFVNSNITTSTIAIITDRFYSINSSIDTSSSSCPPNFGIGKGLRIQITSSGSNCSSGGSSAGHGLLDHDGFSSQLQSYMFLSHAFPYLSRGPNLTTGSGGFGYLINKTQGYGGGIIYLYATTSFQSLQSYFHADGGNITDLSNENVTAGSGGTLFLYTQTFNANNTYFTAIGGSVFNSTKTGGGGLIKISFNQTNNINNSNIICVNVTHGININEDAAEQRANHFGDGTFFGPISAPGQSLQITPNLSFVKCEPKSYSLLGDMSCHSCPTSTQYNSNDNQSGLVNIAQCFQDPNFSLIQKIILFPQTLSWYEILAYFVVLISTLIIGLIVTRKLDKKQSLLQTQQLHIDFKKKQQKDSQKKGANPHETKDLTFKDLLYHIHRITLFGSNNPYSPWTLPQVPAQQIRPYILLQGFKNFSTNFNKLALWTTFQKILYHLLYTAYPLHWWYTIYIKKKKYRNLCTQFKKYSQGNQGNLLNDHDFQDKNLIKIKLSKNTDYTICYIDLMVYYDHINLKYFQLSTPFIINLSGQGSFLKPYYIQDRDMFFNVLYYIINYVQQSTERLQQDEKRKLITDYKERKRKSENNKKLRDFLTQFNTISITLDFSSRISQFTQRLKQLIKYMSQKNEIFFSQFNIYLDLIVTVSKLTKNNNVINEIHILTNRDQQQFNKFINNTIPKVHQFQRYDIKFGIFIYNPNQQINKNNNPVTNPFQKSFPNAPQAHLPHEYNQTQQPFIQQYQQATTKKQKSISVNQVVQQAQQQQQRIGRFQNIMNYCGSFRYIFLAHRKLEMDRFLTKFILISLVFFQCGFTFFLQFKVQVPYLFVNIISPFVGILWLITQSYGIGKLFVILNFMELIDQLVTACWQPQIVIPDVTNFSMKIQILVCLAISILLTIAVIPISTKFLSVTKKLNTSKMFV